jgi:7-cyano-7-deazaguanine reductase
MIKFLQINHGAGLFHSGWIMPSNLNEGHFLLPGSFWAIIYKIKVKLKAGFLRSQAEMRKAMPEKKKTTSGEYGEKEARAGLTARLPAIETFPNQFPDYEITIDIPEYTSVCPKTGLPDFGVITIWYIPDKKVMELKSLKMYILAYRNLGIFYENAINRILEDVVKACQPKKALVRGDFTPRGGLSSTVEARYPRGE